MKYLSETFSQISLEEKRQLISQYTLFMIGPSKSIKKLDNRFTVLLNKLRIQKVTKSDQEVCETFLNALCRDNWNSNRKVLMDRFNPHAPINKITSYSELVTTAAEMEKVNQADASTSFTFVVSLNKRQIVDCDRANNYGRPELFDCDFSAHMARFSRRRRRESFVCSISFD